ncbi:MULTISPECIES: hypothetical protein [unclassified Kitasatospora]|uniref:hypothetical protein n=1 Tax=unclassified Kitasatospora TaxID=2633591 RepID=UPI00070B936C|nr:MULTISPECIES: hypothetical protein [unclassified Kitasatospora]KQV15534.1 hypothetical protein ASC99_08095 [Kitasatospora sp. Root107]KRB63879.1 hypothetical protein ASE03_04770 [Kitasatospora sp. Root187]
MDADQPEIGQIPDQAGEFGQTELLAAGTEELPPATPRRPLGTGKLLLAALLVGPLLGGSVGYAVQAARPATALPGLEVAAPQYPTAPADEKAAADGTLKPLGIDGDLRKLLISRPDGTEEWDNYGRGDDSGWLSAGENAMSFSEADDVFRRLLRDGFRRDAAVTWRKDKVLWRVELVQYQSDWAGSAEAAAFSGYGYGSTTPLPGTASGTYVTPTKAYNYAESTEQYYYGAALARRGDLVMRVSVHSPTQVNADELKDVAKRQWERLV